VTVEKIAQHDGHERRHRPGGRRQPVEELDERGEGRFTGQLFAFVQEAGDRPFVYAHLEQHVQRERQKDDDVAGLFD